MKILVTGGAGFIGSNFLNKFGPKYKDHNFINLDKLTYAANPMNLKAVESSANYFFEHGDITDYNFVLEVFRTHQPDIVIHFAAESHVDRSIIGPTDFVKVNVMGTFNLLEAFRMHWEGNREKLFINVSTDEVYGSLPEKGYFTENTSYDPSSPYSASKASADHFVRAYNRTYGLPVIITNCSNNYGPYQFPEKLIPLMILNAISGKPLPVYGKGDNVRDWLYVEDHCEALWKVAHEGKPGETYNIGGNSEWKNIEVVKQICFILAEETGKEPDYYQRLITFVEDRPGHDKRYAIDATKIKHELSWSPKETFLSGLRKTVRWYLDNRDWIKSVQTGEYKKWIEDNYSRRLKEDG